MGQDIFMAAVQIPVNDLLDIGTEKSVLPFKSLLINLEKGLILALMFGLQKMTEIRTPG